MKRMKVTICLLTLCAVLAAGLAAAVGGAGRTDHFLIRPVRAVLAQTAKKGTVKKDEVKKDDKKKKPAQPLTLKSKVDLTSLSKKFTVIDRIAEQAIPIGAGSSVDEEALKEAILKEINKIITAMNAVEAKKDEIQEKIDDALKSFTESMLAAVTSCYTVKGFMKDMMGFSGLPGVSQDAIDFASGVSGHGLTGFADYVLNPDHMGNQSYFMSGGSGGGAWYGSVSFYDYSGQSGSKSVTKITMTEHYANSSDGSTMTIETRHENGVTTQTVTYTDKDGNTTTETSTDGSSSSGSSDSGSENPPPKEGEGDDTPNPEDDTPGGKPHPIHPIVSACISKMSASQMAKLHDSLWLKIKKGTTVDPSPIDTEKEMKVVILNARKVAGLGNNPVIDYSPEKIRSAVVGNKIKIDPKKIIDPKPVK